MAAGSIDISGVGPGSAMDRSLPGEARLRYASGGLELSENGGAYQALSGAVPSTGGAAAINSAIDALSRAGGGTVTLEAGTYQIEAPILLASNVELRGSGEGTVLVPTFSGAVDDPTNAAIKVLGALDPATMNTTLAVLMLRGARQMTVAAAGTIATSKWVVVRGHNSVAEGSTDGANVITEEMYQVSGVAGAVLSLYGQSAQPHAASAGGGDTITAQAVLPVVNAAVTNLRIACTTDVAVGIYGRYAQDCRIENVAASGLTRRAIELVGVKGFHLLGITCLGNNNGIWLLETCCECIVKDTRCRHGADKRINAHGSPKFSCWYRFRCADLLIDGIHIRNMTLGVAHWGGYQCTISNVEVTACYPVPGYVAIVAAGEGQDGGRMGVALNGGAGPIPLAEFAWGCTFDNIIGSNAYDDTYQDYRFCYFYVHDCYDSVWSNLEAQQIGAIDYIHGMRASDAGGFIRGFLSRGVPFTFWTENQGFDGEVSELKIDGRGAAAVTSPWLRFEHTGFGGLRLIFRHVHFRGSESGQIRFGGSFGSSPDDTNIFFYDFFNGNTGQWADCARVVFNNGSAMSYGDVVEIDGTNSTTGRIWVQPAAGTTKNPCVVIGGSPLDVGTGYLVVAMGPQRRVTLQIDGAGNAGDTWECSGATKRAHVNNASTTPGGRLNFKVTGAGLVECSLRG